MSALRVLLVGDNTIESEHLCALLEQGHHSVLPVPTFDDASEALLIQRFDVVLVTPALSEQGIADFTAHLRDAEKNQRGATRTPVLSVLPGASQAPPTANGFVDAYLPESFEPDVFAKTVENLANALAQSAPSASTTAPDLPVLDIAGFQAQVAYDRELMVEIIDLFLEERLQDMTEMTEAVANRDLQALMRAAHTIKGSLGSLHASLARYRAQELETAAKTGNYQACIALLSALEEDLGNLEPQLLSLRDSAKTA